MRSTTTRPPTGFLAITAQHNNGATTWNTRILSTSIGNAQPSAFYTNAVQAYEDSLETVAHWLPATAISVVNVAIDAAPSQPAIVMCYHPARQHWVRFYHYTRFGYTEQRYTPLSP